MLAEWLNNQFLSQKVRKRPTCQNNIKKELEKQLWNIANALRGNMGADEFRDYILGFIFYKYLLSLLINH